LEFEELSDANQACNHAAKDHASDDSSDASLLDVLGVVVNRSCLPRLAGHEVNNFVCEPVESPHDSAGGHSFFGGSCLLFLVLLGSLLQSSSRDQLIVGHHAFDYTRVHEVDARPDSDLALAVVEDGVEVPEEGFTQNKGVVVVEAERNEALALDSDVNHKRLWHQLHVVPVVHEKVD